MPPRSVCLNLFTTSLGNGVGNGIGNGKEKEVDVEMKEGQDKMEGVETAIAERGRHDSVQSSPNDSIATTSSYTNSIATAALTSPIATTNLNNTTSPFNMGCIPPKKSGQNPPGGPNQELDATGTGTLPTTCSTCAQPPVSGLSLLRCSRCKNAYYCSKTCQKTAWKLHKYDCERAGAAHSPSSALDTPDISTPASPVADGLAPVPQSDGSNDTTLAEIRAPRPYTRRYPQSQEDWAKQYQVIDVAFPRTGIHWLRMYLMEAYSLYANEHGGIGPLLEDSVDEYRKYLDAISERVTTPLQLDDTRKEAMIDTMLNSPLANLEPGAVRRLVLGSWGNALVAEYDRINEAIYGSDVIEDQM